jgi:hypothetical protein
MSETAYANAKDRINIQYKADKMACGTYSGNAADVCEQKASGKEKVARAQLEADYSEEASDANNVVIAEVNSKYATARQLCDDKAGDAKEVCVTEAQATRATGLAIGKMDKEMTEARDDAAEDMSGADYAAAKAKCESLAGVAKESCVNTAKTRFGKD